MKTFPALLVWLATLLAADVGAQPNRDVATESRPNIIVIIVNDLRWDEPGYAGHPFIKTPHIDRLAREGAQFPNAFVTVPEDAGSLAGLLRGTHPTGLFDTGTGGIPSAHAFPNRLRDAGYQTAFVGEWPLGPEQLIRAGFDDAVSSSRPGADRAKTPVTDVFGEDAVQFIQQSRSRPYCLMLRHRALPSPARSESRESMVADRHRQLYADVVPRRTPEPHPSHVPAALLESRSPAQVAFDDETIRIRWRALAAVDDGVGRIVAELERAGQLGNTVIVFTSDQGCLYGEHGIIGDAAVAYEEAIRIPLVIHYSKLAKRGVAPTQIALNIDLAPTLLELARVATAPGVSPRDGVSLVPLLRGEPSATRFSFVIEGNAPAPGATQPGRYQAVRTHAWKYIRYSDGSGAEELYDLHADHYEHLNLARRNSAKNELRRWSAELAKVLRPAK